MGQERNYKSKKSKSKIKNNGRLTATVQRHAAGTRDLVVLPALLLNKLLGHCITGREEHGSRDALGEDRARGQLCLIPRSKGVSKSSCVRDADGNGMQQRCAAYQRNILRCEEGR